MPEWCSIYKNWATSLTGYQTVIDCKPTPDEKPESAIRDLYVALKSYAMDPESLAEPRHQPPEHIGQRYLVYKAVSGEEGLYELRSILDKATGDLIWAGGVYKHIVPGAPIKPPVEPALPEPGKLTPPPTPRGQKTIRKPVVYSAEGPFPEVTDTAIGLGRYSEARPSIQEKLEVPVGDSREITSDFHCVTGWSVGGLKWRGISLLELLESHGLRGRWILTVSHAGYTTIVPYDETLLDDAFIATHLGGERLPREHGGPYRLVMPKLYGWKSLKWLASILVGDVYLDGYWEARGYHPRGLVALDERFKRYH